VGDDYKIGMTIHRRHGLDRELALSAMRGLGDDGVLITSTVHQQLELREAHKSLPPPPSPLAIWARRRSGPTLWHSAKVITMICTVHNVQCAPVRRHGSTRVMTRPAKHDFSDDSRVNTFTVHKQLELPEAGSWAALSLLYGTDQSSPELLTPAKLAGGRTAPTPLVFGLVGVLFQVFVLSCTYKQRYVSSSQTDR
jgi:hypothetical protein